MHIEMLSFPSYVAEILRPWKLFSFAIGMLFLFWGALNLGIVDWDIGISIVMGSLTYLCAPWCVRIILYCLLHRPRLGLLWTATALALSWLVVDGSYFFYHTAVGNIMLRKDNFFISLPSYFILGFIWLYAGTLRDLLHNIQSVIRNAASNVS